MRRLHYRGQRAGRKAVARLAPLVQGQQRAALAPRSSRTSTLSVSSGDELHQPAVVKEQARDSVGATASISSVSELLGIVALVVAIFVVIALAFSIVLIPVSRRAKRVQTGLDEEFGDSIERSANVSSLGLQSRGRGQVRGNGRLVLTPDELRFRQWIPQHETTIPIAAVTSVGTERTWLSKWVGSKLLCVRWRASDGSEDAMAWQVPDLEGWLAALNAHRNQSSA